MTTREPCAGGIVLDSDGRILLIKRANPPNQGRWSVPGGRCLPDESCEDACVREVREETGLEVRIVRTAGDVVLIGPGGVFYDVTDFVCEVVGGELVAGDDATDARWVPRTELQSLDLAEGLIDALTEWEVLPR